jgi:hypothetical protein
MSYTQTDLDRIEAAIAGGGVVSSMTFGETTITFRSLDDMLKLRAIIKAEVAGGTRTRYAATSKGA